MRSGLMIEELYSFQEVITYIEKKKLKGIIFGAGQFGRRWAYQFLKEHGILIDAYCDNNPDLWGTKINGIKVIAPAELESQAEKSFVFIMTQYGTIKIIEKQLTNSRV